MGRPTLSVVVPAFDEEGCIATCVERWVAYLDSHVSAWEVVVVDDGSRDRTAAIVSDIAARDGRIRLVRGGHRGKGGAVRTGMLAASGDWRFLADADLSMPPHNLGRFFAALRSAQPAAHIGIGSREAPGADRINEPWPRHVAGRMFNLFVQAIAVPGIADTQCGFKLFSAAAANLLFAHSRIDGFAFDVEVLFLARRAGLQVREVGIEWHWREGSRVSVWRGAVAFVDILRVRWNAGLGRYSGVLVPAAAVPPASLDNVLC